jgi:hypothetical protein
MGTISYRRYFLFAVKGIFYFLFLLMFCDWCLMVSFSAGSRVPIPSEGKLYPFNSHGVIVYVTRSEHVMTDFRTWISLIVIMMFVGFCGQKLEETMKRRT